MDFETLKMIEYHHEGRKLGIAQTKRSVRIICKKYLDGRVSFQRFMQELTAFAEEEQI